MQSIPKLEKALCNQAGKLLRNLEFMLGQELRGTSHSSCVGKAESTRTDITPTHREPSQPLAKQPERVPGTGTSPTPPRHCWCCCHGQGMGTGSFAISCHTAQLI